jgi:diaminopimelate epimerase
MRTVPVTKMHGTRNDFVIVDQRPGAGVDLSTFAKRVCDRRAGIGADGVIALFPSGAADVRMRVINADGSEAEMCGNGARCAARYLYDAGEGAQFRFETGAGIVEAGVLATGLVRIGMGVPQFAQAPVPPGATFVSMGNPHAILFVEDLDAVDLEALGKNYPQLNVHAAQILDERRITMRHYERGVGFTHACGTGAVACAAAAIRAGLAQSPVTVSVPGGDLLIEWDGEGEAYLTGPAVRVFDGEYLNP